MPQRGGVPEPLVRQSLGELPQLSVRCMRCHVGEIGESPLLVAHGDAEHPIGRDGVGVLVAHLVQRRHHACLRHDGRRRKPQTQLDSPARKRFAVASLVRLEPP